MSASVITSRPPVTAGCQSLKAANEPQGLVASTALVFVCALVSHAATAMTGVLLIRFMTATQFAQLTLALSVVAAASQLLSGALNRIYVVGSKRLDMRHHISEFLGLQILLLACVLLLTAPTTIWLGIVYPFMAVVLIARCLADYGRTIHQSERGFLRYGLSLVSQSVVVLVALACLMAYTHGHPQAWQVLTIHALAYLCSFRINIAGRLVLRRVASMRRACKVAAAMLHGHFLFLMFYFAALGILSQAAVWALHMISDDLVVATYGSAFRYYAVLTLAIESLHTVMLPHLSRIKTTTAADAVLAAHRKMRTIFIPATVVGSWAAGWIIPWIDQGRYPDAVQVFWILAASAVVSFVFSPYVNVLLHGQDFRFLFVAAMALLPLHAVNCLCLAMWAGASGAAVATLLGFGTLNFVMFLRAKQLRRLADPGERLAQVPPWLPEGVGSHG